MNRVRDQIQGTPLSKIRRCLRLLLCDSSLSRDGSVKARCVPYGRLGGERLAGQGFAGLIESALRPTPLNHDDALRHWAGAAQHYGRAPVPNHALSEKLDQLVVKAANASRAAERAEASRRQGRRSWSISLATPTTRRLITPEASRTSHSQRCARTRCCRCWQTPGCRPNTLRLTAMARRRRLMTTTRARVARGTGGLRSRWNPGTRARVREPACKGWQTHEQVPWPRKLTSGDTTPPAPASIPPR